jgi:probable selenium-dependent hydroxylase accessory protein YqeC
MYLYGKSMKLTDAFEIGKHEVVSVVGGGGKTTLMFALARELAAMGMPVITTTTTKLIETEPSLHGSPLLLLEEDAGKLLRLLTGKVKEYGHVTVAAGTLPGPGKLEGIDPCTVDKIAAMGIAGIIIEADGARHKPVKAPSDTEPVIPASTTLVVPVVGMDALGAKLTEDEVFRPEIISRLTGLATGGSLGVDDIAMLVTHTEGIAKGAPTGARIIPLLNKINGENFSAARDIARRILLKRHPQIHKVVLGNVRDADPVIGVVTERNMAG